MTTGIGVQSPERAREREGAQQAHEGRDAGDGCDEEVRLVEQGCVAEEEPLGPASHDHLVADAEREERIGQLSFGHPLDEELDLILEW